MIGLRELKLFAFKKNWTSSFNCTSNIDGKKVLTDFSWLAWVVPPVPLHKPPDALLYGC